MSGLITDMCDVVTKVNIQTTETMKKEDVMSGN